MDQQFNGVFRDAQQEAAESAAKNAPGPATP